MKRTLSFVLVIATIFTAIFATAISASAAGTAPNVRVNASLVEFPDAQPFIDSNDRTLIPVRFVTEALGATVTWEQSTATAVIEQNGITVRVPIGSDTISITESGKTTTAKTDTAAIIKQDRTYVPIRYVAEALGCFVDYSNAYNVVEIHACNTKNGNFTAATIKEFRAQPLTTDETRPSNCNYTKKKAAGEDVNEFGLYGLYRETFTDPDYGFANAHEHWICTRTREVTDYFKTTRDSVTHKGDRAPLVEKIVNEAVAAYTKVYSEYDCIFYSNPALVYQNEGADVTSVAVRGLFAINMHEDLVAKDRPSLSKKMEDRYGFAELTKGPHYFLYDIHLTCGGGVWFVTDTTIVKELNVG